MELGVDANYSVQINLNNFDYQQNRIFRAVATATTLVSTGHTEILPALLPSWRRPPVTLNAPFEHRSEIFIQNAVSVPIILCSYSEQVFPIDL